MSILQIKPSKKGKKNAATNILAMSNIATIFGKT